MKTQEILTAIGFEKNPYHDSQFRIIITGVMLRRYFELDADALERIEEGALKSLYLNIDVVEEFVELAENIETFDEIANIHYFENDDYNGVIDWAEKELINRANELPRKEREQFYWHLIEKIEALTKKNAYNRRR